MKNVINVDSLLDTIIPRVGEVEGMDEELNSQVKATTKQALHSLLISKLPEKDYMCRNSPDYKRAVEDMRKSIDELFEVGDV